MQPYGAVDNSSPEDRKTCYHNNLHCRQWLSNCCFRTTIYDVFNTPIMGGQWNAVIRPTRLCEKKHEFSAKALTLTT